MKRILVVDDNPELVDGVKLTLEMEGFRVLTAGSGADALAILKRTVPDLILADIMMPEMDGYELYERVHKNERWLKVPFLFLTAKTEKVDIRRGKEMGADDYITKPFEPQDLVAAVQGRLKRMAEVTDRPPSDDVWGNVKYLFRNKLRPTRLTALLITEITVIGLLILIPMLIIPTLIANRTSPGGDSPMKEVPAGAFTMGGASPGALPQQEVDQPAFEIDQYEVTNTQYKQFVEATGHAAPWDSYSASTASFPVIGVSWEDAQAYCEWADKRLPTDAEWEKAARGTDGRAYPWGNDWLPDMANTLEIGASGPSQVGSYFDGVSPYGLQDTCGNVMEWVDSWFDEAAQTKTVRGGAWTTDRSMSQTMTRSGKPIAYTGDDVGFRCAR
jgi:formylglycine-generating enzyme required for sulfatase activity/CheY-like chemotaxis protein